MRTSRVSFDSNGFRITPSWAPKPITGKRFDIANDSDEVRMRSTERVILICRLLNRKKKSNTLCIHESDVVKVYK